MAKIKFGREGRCWHRHWFFNVFNLHYKERKHQLRTYSSTRVYSHSKHMYIHALLPHPQCHSLSLAPPHPGCPQLDWSTRKHTTAMRAAHWRPSLRGPAAAIPASLDSLWRRRCPWSASCTHYFSPAALQPRHM